MLCVRTVYGVTEGILASCNLQFPCNTNFLLKIEKSQRILVVGGGAAGVEMAAEIKTEYPDKEVGASSSQLTSSWFLRLFCDGAAGGA